MAKKNINGLLIPAGCLVGLGVGMVMNQVAAGVLIGLGVGFLGFFIAAKTKKK